MPEIPASLQQIIKVCEKISDGKADPSALNDLFLKARQVVAFEHTSLERFMWDVIWTDNIKKLADKLRSELDAHEAALQDLEHAIGDNDGFALEKAGRDLKYSAEEVSVLWDSLNEETGNQSVISPYPVYDRLLKAAHNILKGHINSSILAVFFAPAADFTLRLHHAIKRFTLFYGQSSLSDCAQKVIKNLESGMGAVDRYLHSQETNVLNDAIRLLTSTSITMYTIMADMGQWAAAEKKYAHHPLAEELYRAREANLSSEELNYLWQAVQHALKLELTQVQTLLNHPLGTLCGVHRETLKAGISRIVHLVNEGQKKGLNELNLEEFDKLIFNLDCLIRNDLAHLNIECRLTAGAPNFEELLVTVGLAIDGKIEPEAFRIILQETAEKIAEAQDNLSGAIGKLSAEDLDLLSHCLDCQMKGCQELDSWCESGDKELLKTGWRRIASALPSFKRIYSQMRKNLGLGEESAKKQTCMRCGQLNPASARYCSKCSAVLMQLVQTPPVEYTDLETGLSDDSFNSPLPGNILKLEQLVRSVESGEAYTQEVDDQVGQLLSSAYSYRNLYINRVRPALERSQLDPSVAERFEVSMSSYIEGLEICRNFTQEAEIAYLYNGLEQASAAALELSELQAELDSLY
ncbi:MAG: hypothetical protein ACI376_06100 [Candidatus Bruticola sp.]